jgi:hypothetical protein
LVGVQRHARASLTPESRTSWALERLLNAPPESRTSWALERLLNVPLRLDLRRRARPGHRDVAGATDRPGIVPRMMAEGRLDRVRYTRGVGCRVLVA